MCIGRGWWFRASLLDLSNRRGLLGSPLTLAPLFYDGSGTLDGSVCKLADLVGVFQGLPRSPQSLVLRMPTATPHLLSSSAVA